MTSYGVTWRQEKTTFMIKLALPGVIWTIVATRTSSLGMDYGIFGCHTIRGYDMSYLDESDANTHKIHLSTNQAGYDRPETTDGKLSHRGASTGVKTQEAPFYLLVN